jgi:hypothetical protein
VSARGGRLQPNPALLLARSRASGTCGALVGYLADRVADDQLAFDQRHPAAAGHHGVGSVEHLGQARPWPVAQGRQRRRAPGGGDQVVGRRRHAAVAKQPCRADEPRLTPSSPGWAKTCAYQPGLRTPAP